MAHINISINIGILHSTTIGNILELSLGIVQEGSVAYQGEYVVVMDLLQENNTRGMERYHTLQEAEDRYFTLVREYDQLAPSVNTALQGQAGQAGSLAGWAERGERA